MFGTRLHGIPCLRCKTRERRLTENEMGMPKPISRDKNKTARISPDGRVKAEAF
jgi:hypothetical protein